MFIMLRCRSQTSILYSSMHLCREQSVLYLVFLVLIIINTGVFIYRTTVESSLTILRILPYTLAAMLDCVSLHCSESRINFISEDLRGWATWAINTRGVIPKLIALLAYKNDLAERAILTLGSYALHGPEARVAVLAHGAVPAMLPYMRPDTPIRQLRTFVRTFSNLCSHDDDDDDDTNFDLLSPALPHIHDLLDIEHEESLDVDDKETPFIARDVVVDACTALANIMLGPDECIEAVQAVPGLTARLVALLGHEAANVQGAALSAVGNMLAGTDEQVDRCLEANCLDHIVSLLQCSNTCLVQEAARATANILAGTHSQIQWALKQEILTPIRSILADGDLECQKQAVHAVTCLCCNGSGDQRALLMSSGMLEPYCASLAAYDHGVAGEVLDGLYELMQAAERDGSIKPLCYMLDEFDVLDQMPTLHKHATDEDYRCKIANMIRKYAREERSIVCDEMVFTSKTIVQDLGSEQQPRAIRAVYFMLREQNPPVNALLEAGVMASFVAGLDREANSDLQTVAAWALSNMTANKRRLRIAVIDSGAIPKLIAILSRGGRVTKLAAGALGNLALHGPETRKELLAYMKAESALKELRTYMWSFQKLCSEIHQKSMEKFKPITLRSLPFVYELLVIGDRQIVEDACRACANLTSSSDSIEAVQAVPGLTARLVALLGHEDIEVQKTVLTAVGNMFVGTDTQTDRCLDAGCLDHIISFLRCSEPSLVELATLATRNLFGQTQSHIQQALEKDILTPLLNMLAEGESKRQKLAAYAITNLCVKGSAEQRARVVSRGVVGHFCTLLTTSDRALARNVLGGLFAFIQDARKEDKLKPLCLEMDKVGVIARLQRLQDQEVEEDFRFNALVLSSYLRQEARGEYVLVDNGRVYTLAEIVEEMKSQDLATLTRAAHAARSMLCQKDPPRTAMVQAGVVAPLVAALNHDCSDLKFIAAGALFIMAGGSHKHRVALVNGGAIPKLVAVLSGGAEAAYPAASALGYMSRRAPMTRDLVLSQGAVQAMLPHMRLDTPPDLLRSCIETYRDLCTAIVSTSLFKLVTPALPKISDLLLAEDKKVLKFACSALSNLMHDLNDTEEVLAVPGLSARLVALLEHEIMEVRTEAMAAVGNMLCGPETQVDRYLEAGCLDHIISFLQCSEPSLAEQAARATANILRLTDSHKQLALDKNILTPLLNILADAEPNSFLQFYAICAVANFTNSTREHKMAVVDGGGIPKLVALISQGAAVAEPAALALGNLAAEGPEITALVLSHGAVPAMLPHMRPETLLDLLIICVNSYKNICCGISSSPMVELVTPALPNIYDLLEIKDRGVLEASCKALANLMRDRDEHRDAVQAVPGLTARLVALVGHEACAVCDAALRAVVNMLGGTEAQAGHCLDAGCLDHIVPFLQCSEPSLVELALWATSNMFRHKSSIQRALEKNIMTPLLNILAKSKPNSSLQYHAVGVLNNMTSSGTREHRMAVVDGGGIPKLVALLSAEDKVAELAALALGYIAGDGTETRDLVRAHGAVPAMLPNMRPDRPLKLWCSSVMAYENLCRDHDDELIEILEPVSPMLPHIFAGGEQDPVQTERACGALIVLTKTSEGVEAVQAVPGLTAHLVEMLGHEVAQVKKVAMVAVMHMLSGTDAQVDRCLEAGCVQHVVSYLECRDPGLMEKAREATRDALGATHPRLQRALDEDTLTPLMTILIHDPKYQKRIVKGITNLCRRAPAEQRARVLSCGVLEPYCALLAASDRAVAGEALHLLDVLLQVAVNDETIKPFCAKLVEMGVLDQLKQLREHEDEEVNERARRLLHTYFSGES